MSADIVPLHKSDIDKQVELLKEAGAVKALMIFQTADGWIEFIPPTNTSVWELSGWCNATIAGLMEGDD
jgi:hypothetical protein